MAFLCISEQKVGVENTLKLRHARKTFFLLNRNELCVGTLLLLLWDWLDMLIATRNDFLNNEKIYKNSQCIICALVMLIKYNKLDKSIYAANKSM